MLHKISFRISFRLSLCVLWFSQTLRHKFDLYIYYTKNQKFGCVGRGDLTFLFKSCEIDRSQGDFSSNVENKKSFLNRPSGL